MTTATQPEFNDRTPAEKYEQLKYIAEQTHGDIAIVPLDSDGKLNPNPSWDEIHQFVLLEDEELKSEDVDRLAIARKNFYPFTNDKRDAEAAILTRLVWADGNWFLTHSQVAGAKESYARCVAALQRGLDGGDMIPPFDFQTANDNAKQGAASDKSAPLIKASPFIIRDPALIPKREFLFGSHYIRKYLTATFGAGGGGKSAHAVTEALSMATGRPLLSDNLARPVRVWYVNAEDPADEIERRFAGAVKHFKIIAEQIDGRLFTDSGRDQEFVIVREIARTTLISQPVVGAIIAELKAREIDVLIVDPFVSTHSVNENDNTKIQQVAATWAYIAEEGKCAVELVHHVRKTGEEITADDGRGASALKDKTRSVRVLNPMTREQATAAGLDPTDATSYFRLDHSKTNMSRRGGLPSWRRFVSVKLGNGGSGNLASTQGDEIGVVERWSWPSSEAVVEEFDPALLEGIKARLGGGEYRESDQSPLWAGYVIGEILDIDTADKSGKSKIKRLLGAWIAEGHFKSEGRLDAKRMPRKCIIPVFATP